MGLQSRGSIQPQKTPKGPMIGKISNEIGLTKVTSAFDFSYDNSSQKASSNAGP